MPDDVWGRKWAIKGGMWVKLAIDSPYQFPRHEPSR
jgi:hypothetical protein